MDKEREVVKTPELIYRIGKNLIETGFAAMSANGSMDHRIAFIIVYDGPTGDFWGTQARLERTTGTGEHDGHQINNVYPVGVSRIKGEISGFLDFLSESEPDLPVICDEATLLCLKIKSMVFREQPLKTGTHKLVEIPSGSVMSLYLGTHRTSNAS